MIFNSYQEYLRYKYPNLNVYYFSANLLTIQSVLRRIYKSKTLINENNALLTEIYDIVNKEKYKQLGINISEFMNNESYKRLAKYCLQIHGVSKKPIQILNLLRTGDGILLV